MTPSPPYMANVCTFPTAKLRRLKESERQHRGRRAPLVNHERREQGNARDRRPVDLRARPADDRLANQRHHRAGEANKRERGAEPVDRGMRRTGCARGNGPRDEHQCEYDERDVHRKDQAPRHRVHEKPTRQWTNDRRDPGPCRPRTDGSAALLRRERRDDHGQSAWREERAERALERAARDQHLDARRDRAQEARRCRSPQPRSRTPAARRTHPRATRRRGSASPARGGRRSTPIAGRRARHRGPRGSRAGRHSRPWRRGRRRTSP